MKKSVVYLNRGADQLHGNHAADQHIFMLHR